ncbi:efflux transporter, outer membrane factor lipoprotein, NodT family [Bacteroides clarus YIT 12056]|uniref:Efflux transporter, outer membrane factor lipoprotein, NodT family n=2 Tax=Bacteroides TaxID=816 RepID=A0ABN0CMS9_9BACE|nr:efflux transporter, outer membrane factor lipoprotein, NodT family [Bacteroides clarus YIT 12056]
MRINDNIKTITMKIKLITLSVSCLLLSSCGIYTTYERPSDINTDGLYGQDLNEEAVAVDTASIASLSWRELFTDSHLQTLIEHALQSNTDLLSAQQRIKEAEATLSSAKLAYLPSFMLTPQGGVSSFDKSKGSWTYTGIASASWEIDIFGKLTNAKRRSKALYLQSLEYEQAVSTSLIANVANLYYTLLMLDEQYRISEETAVNWRESVRTMRAMMAAGMTNEASVSQSEANCRQVEASLLDLKQQIKEVENSLSILLGEVPGGIERGHLAGQDFPEELTVGVPLQLLSRRPDVKSAELSLASAFYSTNAARSAFYPSITLSGTAGWTNSAGNMIINPGKLLLSAVGALTQPLFNKGLNIAQLKIAKAQQEEAKLAFQQALLNAGSEVNNALTQVQTARGKTELRTGQITSLENAVRSTQLLMQHGTSTYLEVLTAQQSLLSAQLTQVADRFDEIQGIINLYQALGGGRD